MKALQACGIVLAIDDFGVGQSSLASLAQTPASVLKLDRTLLVGAALNARHEKVLRWAIRLGRDLGMEIVAEGIEGQSQFELLRARVARRLPRLLFSATLTQRRARRLAQERRSDSRASAALKSGRSDNTRSIGVLWHRLKSGSHIRHGKLTCELRPGTSDHSTGIDTGAVGNGRTQYGAAISRPRPLVTKSM